MSLDVSVLPKLAHLDPLGSLRLCAVADPSPHCQLSIFTLPQGKLAKDAPELGFLRPGLPAAAVPLGSCLQWGKSFPVGLSWDSMVPNTP